jgi:hypothetical protein
MVCKYKLRVGSRKQVMNNTAKMTAGGLTKSKLKYNKRGRIVSKKASKLAKTNNRLVNAGYITKKGIFGVVKKGGANKYSNVRESGNYKKFYKIKMENENLNNGMKSLYKNMYNRLVRKFPNNKNWKSLNKKEKKSFALQIEANRLGNIIINHNKLYHNSRQDRQAVAELLEQIHKLQNKKSKIEKEIKKLSSSTNNNNILKELSKLMKDTHISSSPVVKGKIIGNIPPTTAVIINKNSNKYNKLPIVNGININKLPIVDTRPI